MARHQEFLLQPIPSIPTRAKPRRGWGQEGGIYNTGDCVLLPNCLAHVESGTFSQHIKVYNGEENSQSCFSSDFGGA